PKLLSHGPTRTRTTQRRLPLRRTPAGRFTLGRSRHFTKSRNLKASFIRMRRCTARLGVHAIRTSTWKIATDTFSASANRRPDLALQRLAKAINAEHTRYPFN